MFYKLKLRELANVIIDYDIHCLNKPKDAIMNLMVKERFQTQAQAQEKYHRATVSGSALFVLYQLHNIASLGEEYERKNVQKTT